MNTNSKVIAIANEKGGVGKTTTALNIGAGLSCQGKKVLLIDLDQQANLTNYLGFKDDGKDTISDVIFAVASGHYYDYSKVIRKNESEDISYIPASKMLAVTTSVLSNVANSQEVLRNILADDVFKQFDYIILDCRPSLDLLVVNALVASDYILIPVQAEKFALDGVNNIMETFNRVRKTSNPNLKLGGLLITMADTRTNMAKAVEDTLRQGYNSKVFSTVIPRLIEATNSTFEQKSLINMKNSRLGELYKKAAEEVIKWEH